MFENKMQEELKGVVQLDGDDTPLPVFREFLQ